MTLLSLLLICYLIKRARLLRNDRENGAEADVGILRVKSGIAQRTREYQ